MPAMPPKKKTKVVPGQQQLVLNNDSVTLQTFPASTSSPSNVVNEVKESWQHFGEIRWKERFPWLSVKDDGVCCIYCMYYKQSTVVSLKIRHSNFVNK